MGVGLGVFEPLVDVDVRLVLLQRPENAEVALVEREVGAIAIRDLGRVVLGRDAMRHVEQHEALGRRRAGGEGGAGELSGQGDRETEGQRLKKHSSFEALRGSNQLNMLPHEEKISETKGLRKESTRSCRVAQIKCKIAR